VYQRKYVVSGFYKPTLLIAIPFSSGEAVRFPMMEACGHRLVENPKIKVKGLKIIPPPHDFSVNA
jgi:hypothetical protein